MNQKAKVRILAFFGATVAMAGAWYWQSPVSTISNLRQAAVDEDAIELSERVDLTALRNRMRLRLGRSTSAIEAQKSPLGMVMASAMVDTTYDLGAVQRTIITGSPYTALDTWSGKPIEWEVSSRGIYDFRARAGGENADNPIELVFKSNVLDWKLVGINGVPDAATVQAKRDALADLILNFPPNRQDRRTVPNGAEFFSVSGTVTNVGDTTRDLGPIAVTLKDRAGRRISSLLISPSQPQLAPGETTEINEAVTDFPAQATIAEIGWKSSAGIALPPIVKLDIEPGNQP